MKRGICIKCGKERVIVNARHSLCAIHNAKRLAEGKPPKKYVLPKKNYQTWKCNQPVKPEKRKRIRVKPWFFNVRKVLDNKVSKFILAKYGPKCYTCEEELACDNGHYMNRGNDATRWLEDNCRPQGTICNDHKHGNKAVFRERLINEIGIERVEHVEQLAKTTVKFLKPEIIELCDTYDEKLMLLTLDKTI